MTATSSAPRAGLLSHPPFRNFFLGRVLSEVAAQIAPVAIGWQVYALTHSVAALGFVGLAAFAPSLLLIFIGGHVADLYDRRRILQICQVVNAAVAAFLAWGTFDGWLTVPEIFVAIVATGAASAFSSPAVSALLAQVVPPGEMSRASALATAAIHVAVIGGPALGGLAYGVAPGLPYAAMTILSLAASAFIGAIRTERPARAEQPPSPGAIFEGVGFVRRHPPIFGTISLDLFAVLLGGATALLPVYAHDILHIGAWGLGVLRSAPAVGALAMTAVLTRHPVDRHVGLRMFQAVIVFGLATMLFAVSREFWLSLVALLVMGASDTISMVIRISLVQLATPASMRGRVGAVNFLFIRASNELGEFESGMAAALLGTVPAALLGGLGTILVALLWMRLFPTLRDFDRYDEAPQL